VSFHLRLAFASLASTALVVAQQHVVLPAKAGYREQGNTRASYLFPDSASVAVPAHTQVVNDVAGVPVPQATFRGLSVRRATGAQSLPAVTSRARIALSVGPRPWDWASATFAENAGTETVVFNGTLSLAARGPQAAWPAPWETELPFQQTFAYDRTRGRSLVLDFVVTQNSARASWDVEATGIESGTVAVELLQPDCLTTAATPNVGYTVDRRMLYPGGRFELRLTDLPRNAPSFATNRLIFGGTGSGGSFGSLTLPFRISTIGLPSHPQCRWTVDDVAEGVLGYTPATGVLSVGFPLPTDPIIAERPFFTQALCIDQDSQVTRLFPTLALKWTIGTGKVPPATVVTKPQDTVPPSATGTLAYGEAPVLRLRY
jgi:hypothetical protein